MGFVGAVEEGFLIGPIFKLEIVGLPIPDSEKILVTVIY